MTVEEFKEKFEALQKESNEVYSQIKPLLQRLKRIVRKATALADRCDNDPELYDIILVKDASGTHYRKEAVSKDWDVSLIIRLADFKCLDTDEPMSGSLLECLDYVLDNMKHAKFYKQKGKK